MRLTRRSIVASIVMLALLGAGSLAASRVVDQEPTVGDVPGDGPPTAEPSTAGSEERIFASNDPVERGCALPADQLVRIWRGFDAKHYEDITMVPLEPNFTGTFDFVSHTGPWDYVQEVPLVLYGPGRIVASGQPLERAASLVDVWPTVGAVTKTELPERTGEILSAALVEGVPGRPKLIATVMWDGAGANVLARWPDAWPTLARLEREGTSFRGAIVGSSPSITPTTHSTLGTGAYPRKHGVTSIQYRDNSGVVRSAFKDGDPSDLKLTTFADLVDLAFANRSKVGLVAWRDWHLGMLGHGRALDGGDADQYALISETGTVGGNQDFYETPGYLERFPGLNRRANALDREDGKADGLWLGHSVLGDHNNPAWARFQGDIQMALLKREGYGRDDIPDLFFTNFKMTDLVGHVYNLDSPEMEAVVRAQDQVLARLVRWLERDVKDFVLILSADHGHTPPPEETGAWAIDPAELAADIDDHFGVPDDASLIEQTHATGIFLDRPALDELDIAAEEVGAYINSYRIADNSDGALPARYRSRGDENAFAAAWAQDQLDDVLICAFGSSTPPGEGEA